MMDSTPAPDVASRPPGASAAGSRHVWLAVEMLRRDLRDRYAGTAWGLVWAVVQPLLMLALYAFVFAWVFKIRLPGADGPQAYVIFVAVVLWPWFMIQECLQRSLSALRSQATLIHKTTMPRDLPVLVACGSTLVIHGVGYVLVLAALQAAGAGFVLRGVPLVLLTLASLTLLILAAGMLASLCQLIWRDLEQALQPILMVLFYATPILYPLSLVPDEMREIISVSPLAWILGRLRDGLQGGVLPGAVDAWVLLIALLAMLGMRHLYLKVVRQAEALL